MDLLSLCPLPAAPLLWQLTPSRWVLTVVCKATYRLEPGVVSLADEQEPLHDEENHWEDDPSRSLFAPADLVPFKLRADVVLVGSAFARGGQPARSTVVRLTVGKIDKAIEVLCPRVRTRDGELREGKRWTKMPLLYERAAGGEGTDNPAGIGRSGARDPYGQLALPNLQPPGLAPDPDKLPPPIGFGPIAASWPVRKGRLPAGHPDRDWARMPFGDGFDPMFFQAAPVDQQMDTLRPTERIALENLHPKHASLVTSLPGDKPRARIELRGSVPREIALVPDTLWLDTDRGLCTVTFRGKVDVEHSEQEGRILVATQKGDQPIPWARLAPAPLPPPPSQASTAPPISLSAPLPSVPAPPTARPPLPSPPSSPSPPLAAVPPPRPSAPAPPPPPAPPLPPGRLAAAPPKVPPPPRPPAGPAASEPAAGPSMSELDIDMLESVEVTLTEQDRKQLEQTAALRPITVNPVRSPPEASALPFQPAPPGWSPPASLPSRPGLPPLPGVPGDLFETPPFGAPAARGTLPDWFESGAMPPSPGQATTADPGAPPAPPPLVPPAVWTEATPPPLLGPFSALEASNAAAGVPETLPGRPEAEPAATPPPIASVVVELLWLDPQIGPRLAQHPVFGVFKRLPPAAPAPAKPPDPPPAAKGASPVKPPEPPAPKTPEPALDPALTDELIRAHVYDALTRGTPSSPAALDAVLEVAEEESPPPPAIALVSGTLELCLDEIEMLKAIAIAASPLASSDKKLKEAIDVATEMLKSPMLTMPDFAEGLSARIRDAWSKANRALPADYLSACTERLLVEQRSYQKRELLDDAWIRALLTGSEGAPVPVYLPARIAKRLPLYRRFPARLLAEVVWQQDQYETHPLALKTLALGRLPARARQSASRTRKRG